MRGKRILQSIILLLACPIVGALLLFLVHLLPTGVMKEHLYYSQDIITKENLDEVQLPGYPASFTGNFTDCLMLEHAIYRNSQHSAFSQAMHMYRLESHYDENDPSGWSPGVSLIDYINGNPQAREVEYARYWHGYLLVLKPLLLVTSLGSIRILNASLSLILLGITVILLYKRSDELLSAGFVCTMPFFYYFGMYASLSQSICFYLMLISLCILLLLKKESLEKFGVINYFLLVGASTAYFDFLTYPLVTLAFPLVVYGYLYWSEIKPALIDLIKYPLAWAAGYGFMWASKWAITDLFYQDGIIKNAISTVFSRTSGAGENRISGWFAVIKDNLAPYLNWGYAFLLGFILVAMMLLCVICKAKLDFTKWKTALALLIPAVLPFAWYFICENHSKEHWMFTCKILSIVIFAVLAAFAKLFSYSIRNDKINNSNEEKT